MVNIQLQKEEALKRLEILKQKGLKYSPAIKCFKDGKDIGIFENQRGPMKSVFYWLYGNTGDDDFYDQLAKKVKTFEAEENSIVYLILVSHTVFGTVCSFLYVSDSPDIIMFSLVILMCSLYFRLRMVWFDMNSFVDPFSLR